MERKTKFKIIVYAILIGIIISLLLTIKTQNETDLVTNILDAQSEVKKLRNTINELYAELEQTENDMDKLLEDILFYNNYVDYIMNINSNITKEEAWSIVASVKMEVAKYDNLTFGLVFAQIEQESTFNPMALGLDNDTGLMQILPDTAFEIANKLKIKDFNISMLYDIKTNIKMGTFYLNERIEMAKKYTNIEEEQVRLGLVAYNAGTRAYSDFKNKYVYRNNYHNKVFARMRS